MVEQSSTERDTLGETVLEGNGRVRELREREVPSSKFVITVSFYKECKCNPRKRKKKEEEEEEKRRRT